MLLMLLDGPVGNNAPGFRPWQGEQGAGQGAGLEAGLVSTASGRPPMHAPPAYYSHPGHHAHLQQHYSAAHHQLPTFQSQFNFNESVPPPNTQAPAGPPVPTSRYPPSSSHQQFTSLEVVTIATICS